MSESGEIVHRDDNDKDEDESYDFSVGDSLSFSRPSSPDNQATTSKSIRSKVSYPYHSHYSSEKEANVTITQISGFLGGKWKQSRQDSTSRGVSDATYKIITEKYPVLTVGTTDKDRAFHQFGYALVVEEKGEDFEFVFKTIKNNVAKIPELPNYQPTTLIADTL